MGDEDDDRQTYEFNAAVTQIGSWLSVIGSIAVIVSYLVVRSNTSNPRAARLIFYLSVCDFIWFSSAIVLSSYWLRNQEVPRDLCLFLGPVVSVTRISSIAWTSVIAFDCLQQVKRRKWRWKSNNKIEMYYFLLVAIFAIPGAIVIIAKQANEKGSFGCGDHYEQLGEWWVVMIADIFPIVLAFMFNIITCLLLRESMPKAYPHSVRKRRRKMMYHYIIVGTLCWGLTITHYCWSVYNEQPPSVIEITARATLYSCGFFNFLVYGTQDPHLKRSLKNCLIFFGMDACCLEHVSSGQRKSLEKNVIFDENTLVKNAEVWKDPKAIYVNKRLSREERAELYKERPDLNLSSSISTDENALDKAQGLKETNAQLSISVDNPVNNMVSMASTSPPKASSGPSLLSQAMSVQTNQPIANSPTATGDGANANSYVSFPSPSIVAEQLKSPTKNKLFAPKSPYPRFIMSDEDDDEDGESGSDLSDEDEEDDEAEDERVGNGLTDPLLTRSSNDDGQSNLEINA